MRITPLAVWISKLNSPEEIYKAVEADVTFTHPNKLVIDSCFLYCVAINYLINFPEENDRGIRAFNQALEFSKEGSYASYID
jgi:ADP-ribosylglycohydrolase